jgi:hypothetical protein
MPTDLLLEHYIDTLLEIQRLAMADVPRCFRTKPWSRDKLAPLADMLAQGARLAAAEPRKVRRAA